MLIGVSMSFNRQVFGKPAFSITMFCLLSAFLVLGGYYLYTVQQKKIKNDAYSELTYTSRLKEKQIINWLEERRTDANDIKDNEPFINDINAWFTSPNNIEAKFRIQNFITSIIKNNKYSGVYLFNNELKMEMAFGTGKTPNPEELSGIKNVLETKEVFLTDLHRYASVSDVYIDLIIPLRKTKSNNEKVSGIFLIKINATNFLFPIIQSWPTESKSAETLIIRREGDSVLFLNDLRFRKNIAMKLKIPLTNTNIPSVRAAIGYQGIFEGIDYRGIPVLSDILNIPGTEWSMISKVDLDEIMVPLLKATIVIVLFVAGFILIAGVVLLLFWKNQQSKFYQEKYQLEIEKQVIKKHFDFLIKHASDIILLFDGNYSVVEANDKALTTYGYDNDEILTLSIADLRTPEVASTSTGIGKENELLDGTIFETLHRRKDGTIFPAEVSSRLINIEGKKFYQSIIRDITQRKAAEETIKQSLKEKEVLIREIYHRTKNNMQVISSMLGLRASSLDDENMKNILGEMVNRIQTIALVHQNLIQSKNLSSIDLKGYVTELLNMLMDNNKESSDKISMDLDLECVSVLMDTAIPCGLVINELFSNALKHAFPGDRGGHISVKIHKEENDIIEIIISDNGISMPHNFDLDKSESLGLLLMRNLVESQLQGDIKFDTTFGVTCTVRFKDILYEERV
jgi:PAS domain S-box-containing protein